MTGCPDDTPITLYISITIILISDNLSVISLRTTVVDLYENHIFFGFVTLAFC